MELTTQPTPVSLLAQLRSTRDADADTRFRALLYPALFGGAA